MDRNVNKKSKVKADRSTKSVIYQLVYDFLKRDDSACEVAELLKKKIKLVGIYVAVNSSTLHAVLVRTMIVCPKNRLGPIREVIASATHYCCP